MRRTIAQTGRRNRLARLGSAVGGSAIGRGGSGILVPPSVYSSLKAPGGYGRTAGGVTAHTHSHAALLNLLVDDHSQYLLAPRAKLRIVAPAGAPYSDPQTAIEACSAGDVVLVLGGTYALTGTIMLPNDHISVWGQGSPSTILNWTDVGAAHLIDLNGKNGFQLRDIGIQAPAGRTGRAVRGTGDDTVLQRVRIIGPNLTMATDIDGARTYVDTCYLEVGGNYAFSLTNANDAVIFNCTVISSIDVGSYALRLISCHRARVLSSNFLITGAATIRAVYVYDSDDVLFAQNYINMADPNGGYGIWFNASSRDCYRNRIIGNTVNAPSPVAAGRQIYLATANPFVLDETMVQGNLSMYGSIGVRVNDVRVRESRVHDNNVHTCTVPISDLGTNTDDKDNT